MLLYLFANKDFRTVCGSKNFLSEILFRTLSMAQLAHFFPKTQSASEQEND